MGEIIFTNRGKRGYGIDRIVLSEGSTLSTDMTYLYVKGKDGAVPSASFRKIAVLYAFYITPRGIHKTVIDRRDKDEAKV